VGKGLNEHVCQPGNPQDGLHIARNPERSGLEAPFFEVYRNKQTYYSGLVSIDEAQIFLDPLGTDVRPGRRRSPLRTQKDLLPRPFGRLDCSLARIWHRTGTWWMRKRLFQRFSNGSDWVPVSKRFSFLDLWTFKIYKYRSILQI
jgi:hypothetical protein